MNRVKYYILIIGVIGLFATCKQKLDSNQEMVELLHEQDQVENNPANMYAIAAVLQQQDSIINNAPKGTDLFQTYINKANALLQLGKEQQAVRILDSLNKTFIPDYILHQAVIKNLALAYMRLGERTNCINNH